MELEHEMPAGEMGRMVARAFGQDPEQRLAEDLRRVKQILEAGEVPTIEGQPMGR